MKVGMVGLGKLGLPVCVAMGLRGAVVTGTDKDPSRMNRDPKPELERGPDNTGHYSSYLKDVFDSGNLSFGTVQDVVDQNDIVFVSVQTPHDERFEGITPIPYERKDFDYSYLIGAVREIVKAANGARRTLVIISTCLPGTMRKIIKPILPPNISLVYNPYFIAMGTTMWDFLNPEAVLIGADSKEIAQPVMNFYRFLDISPLRQISIESAELAKVGYNTWISGKLSITNVFAEICHKTEADIDEVMGFLKLCDQRITSQRYMDAGMGDGGGCHPRDNIAMSWLANHLEIHHDIFDSIMAEREDHAKWLAGMLLQLWDETGLPIVIMGYAYKPETNLTIGSHALLVQSILKMRRPLAPVKLIDLHVEPSMTTIEGPAVFLIGCKHPEYEDTIFPEGSVVIDPWRYIDDQEGIDVIRIGESK